MSGPQREPTPEELAEVGRLVLTYIAARDAMTGRIRELLGRQGADPEAGSVAEMEQIAAQLRDGVPPPAGDED